MYTPNVGSVNSILDQMIDLLSGAQDSMSQNLRTMNKNGSGVLDPVQMAQLQIYTQNFLAVITTTTSLIKQYGDSDKQVATNIGQ